MPSVFEDYLARWHLTPDGAPIVTRSSRLLPVRQGGVPAILKLAMEAEERLGNALMPWWAGDGAARVLAHQGNALLMERAEGGTTLAGLVHGGRDDDASRIICAVVARLHARRTCAPPPLIPLGRWFRDLQPVAASHGGVLALSAAAADELLVAPREVVVLHGDIHHGNVLDFGARGWLAIDPKGLLGERGFDYANLFCNPDHAIATVPGRLARQVDVVCRAAGLERSRLLKWVLAWAGLSASWLLDDGIRAGSVLDVATLAAAELGR